MPVISCGNIGNPWIGEVENLTADHFVVLELSSFQLKHCLTFRPDIAVLLNLTPNHEDWHDNFADYRDSKLRIFSKQTSDDLALYSEEVRRTAFPHFGFTARTQPFSTRSGEDNPNCGVVALIAEELGCEKSWVTSAMQGFKGIEHRLETFLEKEGVSYVNDSKSTTVSSLEWALRKYPNGRIILIAGGHPKSRDFDAVQDLIKDKVKEAILIGEARGLLAEAWTNGCVIKEAESLKHAVNLAKEAAESGDVVLLSPACASFDMFKNYQDRGTQFKALVQECYDPQKENLTTGT